MKKRVIITVLTLFALGIAIVSLLIMQKEDETPPVISVSSNLDLTYSSGMDESLLLEGVTATDDKDGDVTNSLRIDSILESQDGHYAVVTYAAKDKSGNVSKLRRLLNWNDSGETVVTPTPTAVPTATPTPTPEATPEPTAEPSEATDANELARQANEAAIAALSPAAPRMYLSDYVVNIAQGSEFNSLSYVSDITDDADSRDDLFTQIQIVGSVDTTTIGTYELIYYVIDNDGNMSNEAKLTVNVG